LLRLASIAGVDCEDYRAARRFRQTQSNAAPSRYLPFGAIPKLVQSPRLHSRCRSRLARALPVLSRRTPSGALPGDSAFLARTGRFAARKLVDQIGAPGV